MFYSLITALDREGLGRSWTNEGCLADSVSENL